MQLHLSAREEAGIGGASTSHHTGLGNALPSNPKTAVTFETRRDKISFPLLVLKAPLLPAMKGLLHFFLRGRTQIIT